MKIACYIPTGSFFVGGGEIVPLMQAEYLQKNAPNDKIYLITLATDKESGFYTDFKKRNENITFIELTKPAWLNDIESRNLDHTLTHELYYSLSRDVESVCLEEGFDVVLTHYAPAALTIPRKNKQILFLHGVPSSLDLVNHSAVLVADKLLSVSNSVGDGWRLLMNNAIDSVLVQHNGIDETRFVPSETPMQETIDILYVGRLIEIKGVQYLIDAVSELVTDEKFSNIKVVIGGKGPYEETLKNKVAEMSLEKYIQFAGFIPDQELSNFYLKSKVCVFPSYDKEGVLTTMLEAASCGRAVSTAACCGMVDFIRDNENGLLFAPKDGHSMKNALETLLTNNELRQQLGKKARQDILSYWTWNHSAERLIKIINDVVHTL